MTYPTLSKGATRDLFDRYQRDKAIEEKFKSVTVFQSGASFKRESALHLSNVLWELANQNNTRKSGRGSRFERQAASIVHEGLALSPVVAGDAGFWRWLTFLNDGVLAELVDWRYGGDDLGSARESHYGLGNIKNGMYGYLWLCADAVVDQTLEDPYELTRRGDVDVWQSHVVRIDFGSVPEFTRAFIRFVFPSEEEQTLTREEYRELAKELTRRNSSMSFELLDEDACMAFIEDVWRERDYWRLGRDFR